MAQHAIHLIPAFIRINTTKENRKVLAQCVQLFARHRCSGRHLVGSTLRIAFDGGHIWMMKTIRVWNVGCDVVF